MVLWLVAPGAEEGRVLAGVPWMWHVWWMRPSSQRAQVAWVFDFPAGQEGVLVICSYVPHILCGCHLRRWHPRSLPGPFERGPGSQLQNETCLANDK